MAQISINICIACDGGIECHVWFYDAEAGNGNWLVCGLIFFIKLDLYTIVARSFELEVVIGQVETVVCVEHGRVE